MSSAPPEAEVNRAPEPPNPEFPNFDLTEAKAHASVESYCRQIYDPAFPLLSDEHVKFGYAHRAEIDADVKKCISWFNVKQIMADRKVAMRYCVINHDYSVRTSGPDTK